MSATDAERRPLEIGRAATMACVLEATAPKPGNVHPGAGFADAGYLDFVSAATAIGPVMQRAVAGARVGATVLAAIEASRRVTPTNVNLGTVLLLAPLCRVGPGGPLREGCRTVLADLDARDAADVYAAIRLAEPGGLGRVPRGDVAGPAPDDLLAAMRDAAQRDLVAAQYAGGFAGVFDEVVPWLAEAMADGLGVLDAIVRAQLRLLAAHPDSLIARKCGPDVAGEASRRAAEVQSAGVPGDDAYAQALAEFDAWLRADGHRRNPGTTADLLAAGLFVCLRDGIIAGGL